MNTQKTALVTGASSGIGLAVSKALLSEGYTVYGIGRTFPDNADPRLIKLVYDLTDTRALPAFLKANVPSPVSLLLNCAGVAYYGPHETLSPAAIHEMVTVNTEVPLLLTNLLLRDLKKTQGAVVNVSSVTAKLSNNTHGCAYGATKAALSHFSQSLFEEVRKSGVKVITVHPDLTDTNLYRNADFRPSDEPDCVLLPEDVSKAVLAALNARDGLVVNDITIRPQRNKIVREKVK